MSCVQRPRERASATEAQDTKSATHVVGEARRDILQHLAVQRRCPVAQRAQQRGAHRVSVGHGASFWPALTWHALYSRAPRSQPARAASQLLVAS
jgi:hypothetical protein